MYCVKIKMKMKIIMTMVRLNKNYIDFFISLSLTGNISKYVTRT